MKSGFIMVLAVLFVFIGSSIAMPSLMGYRGVNRVADGKPMGSNEINFGVFLRYWASTDQFDGFNFWNIHTGSDTTLDIKDKEQLVTGYLSVGYGITDWMEIAARMSYVASFYERDEMNARNFAGKWEDIDGMGDTSIGMKFGFSPTPSNELLWLGLQNWYTFAPKSNQVMPSEDLDGRWVPEQLMWEVRRPTLSTGHTSYGIGLITSFDLANVWSSAPLRLHLNGGFSQYKQNFNFDDFRFEIDSTGHGINLFDTTAVDFELTDNVIDFGVGIEFPTRFATLFLEYYDWHYIDRDSADDVAYLTPGIRFTTNTGMFMDVCFDVGLSDYDPEYYDLGHAIYNSTGSVSQDQRENRAPLPTGGTQDWGVCIAVAFASELIKEEAPRDGSISGLITDAGTGEPIGTTITFPGMPIANVTSDPVTGFYTVTVTPGTVPISVAASGYTPASATIVLDSRQDVVMDFQLERNAGIITGVVLDFETGDPVMATISIDTEEPVTTECGADGVYQAEVSAGTYTIMASHPDYLDKSLPAVINADETSVVNFELRKRLREGQVLSFDNIYFDSGSANIKPESYSILDGVVQVLKDNMNARVQIAGHTDSDGSEGYNQTLSEQRAASVFSYLVNHGIAASRLTTIGFGESSPVAPNNSATNKARNRRIEFTVLSI